MSRTSSNILDDQMRCPSSHSPHTNDGHSSPASLSTESATVVGTITASEMSILPAEQLADAGAYLSNGLTQNSQRRHLDKTMESGNISVAKVGYLLRIRPS